MPEALKDSNRLNLFLLLLMNLVLFYGLAEGDSIAQLDWSGVLQRIHKAVPATAALALIGILNAQISASTKARIVFMKWDDPLPGFEAFSKHAPSDPRIDMAVLRAKLGPLPTEPKQQNALWYRLFKSIDADPAVSHVHRDFLFTRDYAVLSLMMLLTLSVAAKFEFDSASLRNGYWAFLLIQFYLTIRAARNHGIRLVTTVLALKCTQK